MAIIGYDDRVPVQTFEVTDRPYSAVVLIQSTFPDGTVTTGSGAMIGPDDVLTAAHCIYSRESGGWAQEVLVSPAHTPRGATFGIFTGESMTVVNGWFYHEDFNYDYGYIDLSSTPGFETGWFDVASRGAVGSLLESLGYPGDWGGTQMVYTAGTVDTAYNNVFYFTDDFDMYFGQSGSPVTYSDIYGNIDIVGVISHHINYPTMNGVLRLSQAMVDQIDQWAATSKNDPAAAGNVRFDEAYYLDRYPDIAAAVSGGTIPSGQVHFSGYGWAEGRDPCGDFDTSFYLACNPDVAAAGVNPLTHYLTSGAGEGRLPCIDAADYLLRYPDVAAGYAGAAADHYALYGQYEGRTARSGASGYDETAYLMDNVADFTSAQVEILGVPTEQSVNVLG